MHVRVWVVALGWFSLALAGRADVSNWWPFFTSDSEPAPAAEDWTAAGPIISHKTRGNTEILSLRPLWTQFEETDRDAGSHHLLYPLFNYYWSGDSYHWHLLNLARGARRESSGFSSFEVFPFYFSRQTGDPETSYRALWPLGGTLKNFLWRDRLDFVAWPLYIRSERGDEVRYSIPWPFIQFRTGPESRGWGVWPLYGHFERDGSYDHTWALWPFYYDLKNGLGQPQPYERFGVLPFYARERGPGLISETYGWPFFGYTREFDPRPDYSEIRYFYPLLVQGRGEERSVNRWMPFFTDERRPDYAMRWYLWPFLKQETFQLPDLTRRRTQFLFFLYRDEHQFNEARGFSARRTYLWPFFGYANNGQGRRQIQALDPLGPFFPLNAKIGENWSPLFAVYRYDDRPDGTRHSALWNLIVVEREADGTGSVHIGPLFEYVDDGESGYWEVLKGLIGRAREAGEKQWTFFWKSF